MSGTNIRPGSGERDEYVAAQGRSDKPRSWMYGVEIGYLVNVCECAFDLLDAAEANPIPLTSATAMRWHDLTQALEALHDAC